MDAIEFLNKNQPEIDPSVNKPLRLGIRMLLITELYGKKIIDGLALNLFAAEIHNATKNGEVSREIYDSFIECFGEDLAEMADPAARDLE